jgi:hypothetical protein
MGKLNCQLALTIPWGQRAEKTSALRTRTTGTFGCFANPRILADGH